MNIPQYVNDTTGEVFCQDEIFEQSLNDSGRKWHIRKGEQMRIANVVECYDKYKAAQLRDCGTHLTFNKSSVGNLTLTHANFCRIRICPMCTWRRTLKLGLQMQANYAVQIQRGYKHIFLTLTVKNVSAADLSSTLDDIMASTDRMHKLTAFNTSIVGYFRALEVTYNERQNTYHPHLHYILTVPADYYDYTGKNLTQAQMADMWRKSMRLDYDPMINVKRIEPRGDNGMTHAVAETAKYPLKATNILELRSRKRQVQVCETIDNALKSRRLIAFGGVTRQIRAELKQSDLEDELVNLADDAVSDDSVREIIYVWRNGLYLPIEFQPVQN